MKNFKPITYLIKSGLVEFSLRHLRRLVKEEYEKGDNTSILKIKNNKGLSQYFVHINSIEKYSIRKRTKKTIEPIKVNRNIKSQHQLQNSYDVAISINFKNNYNKNYYEFLAKRIFETIKMDMYYVVEKDDDKQYHLHIGAKGLNQIDHLKDVINQLIYDEFGHSNKDYKNGFAETKQYILIEKMVKDYAYRNYLSKGDDGLGGAKPTFLDVAI